MPASNGRRSATSASAAITAGRFARRTSRKPASRWSRTSRRASTIPAQPGNIGQQPEPHRQLRWRDLGALLAGLPNVTYSLPIISGSNPNLMPETVGLLDGRRGHPAALHPGLVAQRRLLQHQGERRHRLARARRRSSTAATTRRRLNKCSAPCSRAGAVRASVRLR